MSAVEEQIVLVDEWRGLYGESWKGVIVDEAFAHPAKFSRALIRKIYDHVIAEGWATKGDSLVDPFGGVALGGFDAMRHGLNWTGCELEMKFVGLGTLNILQWENRFSGMPNWGTARLLQGDSRKLSAVLRESSCCVTSPPYANDTVNERNGIDLSLIKKPGGHNSQSRRMSGYGEASGQLGAMNEGDHSIAISSPPYHGNEKHDSTWQERSERAGKTQGRGSFHSSAADYGTTDGQLGAMPEGQLCVTSPPYNPPMSQDHNGTRGGQRGTTPSEKGAFVKYGNSDGQLEGMSMDGFSAAVSSPPYEGCESTRDTSFADKHHRDIGRDPNGHGAKSLVGELSSDPQNIGNQRGETFWSASRLILEQLHQVLAPNAHAIFVVKAFVRDKKIVDFPSQWAQLCEAVGFRLLHDHHALLAEHYGTQGGFDGDKAIRVERKSFFRRLAESKGSPRIDHENVLCFQKMI